MHRNPVTLKDVAARAGVSVGTAYNALSGKSPVSEQARGKVLAAASALNYKTSDFGRRLRTGRSRTLALISSIPSSMSGWFVMEMLNAAVDEASRLGYSLTLLRPSTHPEQALELIEKGSADGVILMQVQQQDRRIAALQRRGVAFVSLGRTSDPSQLNWVDFDLEGAIFKALEHLVHLGHRRIGVIGPLERGPQHDLGILLHLGRGFARAEGLGAELVHQSALPTIEAGAQATERLLEARPDLSAVLASYGSTHFGVLQALHRRGLRVPTDLSVVAITSEQSAIHSVPRLTSVDIPQIELGRQAVRQLIHQLEDEPTLEQALLVPDLVLRDSTAPPRAG